ncbi:flagellar protein FliT [Clostridium botulinum]|uniref:flagellar protein FliT n=1 Tax=Clostridium botulinum TaxID=1491 RepID=UPI0005F99C00|nr:flagellar protein FliT [Clostridium botulinum]MBD5644701.1 flagellar protein FliT [Clostridium botulinum]NFM45965.1 flagellar protein FliT [Clostridium botulinum]PSL98682.1 flagellar protein FliT [Clostridium botulinum]HDK7138028.1 flagellar protein FliT [Clostridium botulinum]HDK7141356.1 flagellar protein FliT [Clostridium botulinum]
MDKLKENLIKYRDLTLNIIEALEREDYDIPEKFLEERQSIINEINNLPHTKEEFKSINNELDLILLEKKLQTVMLKRKVELKQKINNALESKEATKSYNMKQFNSQSILNKTI